MALQLSDYLGLPIQGNPMIPGIQAGQDIVKSSLENYTGGVNARYAKSNAFLANKLSELQTKNYPAEMASKMINGPNLIALMLTGKLGDTMKKYGEALSHIPGLGSLNPVQSTTDLSGSGGPVENDQQLNAGSQDGSQYVDANDLMGSSKNVSAGNRPNGNSDQVIGFDPYKPIKINVPWKNKPVYVHQKDVTAKLKEIQDWKKAHGG